MAKFRVMVVDDDPDIRFVTMGLIGLDFECVQAENGLDALEKIDRYEPDLILLDIKMPIMDGFATCRAIRRNKEFSSLPVFFLTGAASDESRAQASASGSHAYIEKPFDAGQLIDEITGFFEKRGEAPAEKLFSLEDLDRIDASPLKTSGSFDQISPPAPSSTPSTESFSEAPATDSGKKRGRRVFGAGRVRSEEKPPGSTPEIVEPEVQETPTVPSQKQPEVRASSDQISAQWTPSSEDLEKPDLTAKKQDTMRPAAAAWSPSSESVEKPKVEPPKLPEKKAEPPRPPITKPAKPEKVPTTKISEPTPSPVVPAGTAPPPIPASTQKSLKGPHDGKALRRKIPKVPGAKPKSARPRVLCLLSGSRELGQFTEALKGFGEFLPLELAVEAVEIIANYQPDVVIMRVQTREYSGLQIAQMLQANPRLSHIELLFMASGKENPTHLSAVSRYTSNQKIKLPLMSREVRVRLEEITSRPSFKVREKKLSYGDYVSTVLSEERRRKALVNKELEQEAVDRKNEEIAGVLRQAVKQIGDVKQEDPIARRQRLQSYYLK